MKPDQVKTFDLTVSRLIPGPPEEVFDVWLDTKSPGGIWFGVERAIINLAVDGLFYHVVKHENRSWPHYGRFIRLERGRAIEHTWVSEATRGTRKRRHDHARAAAGRHRRHAPSRQPARRRDGARAQRGLDLVPGRAGPTV